MGLGGPTLWPCLSTGAGGLMQAYEMRWWCSDGLSAWGSAQTRWHGRFHAKVHACPRVRSCCSWSSRHAIPMMLCPSNCYLMGGRGREEWRKNAAPSRQLVLSLIFFGLLLRGEELQKKLCSTDGTRPAVNLEQEEGVLKDAFTLFHGNASGVTLNTAVPEGQRVQPASPAEQLGHKNDPTTTVHECVLMVDALKTRYAEAACCEMPVCVQWCVVWDLPLTEFPSSLYFPSLTMQYALGCYPSSARVWPRQTSFPRPSQPYRRLCLVGGDARSAYSHHILAA
eukprot:1156514-Pelagomonas_calceolata.AAC.6